MLIEFNKLINFYDKLNNTILNNRIIYNFIPIKYYNDYFILTCLKNLEGYLIEYKNKIPINIYIENEKISLTLNSVIYFNNHNLNLLNKYDCYIDSHTNLLLIRFYHKKLQYININSDIDMRKEIFENTNIFNKINYTWTDENLNIINYKHNTKLRFTWDSKFINLPPIPYLIDSIHDEILPYTGSGIFNDKQLVGMISYITNYEIFITPLISIKRFLKYLEGEFILYLNIDTVPVYFDNKNNSNLINYDYGLIIENNYYNLLIKKNNCKISDNNESIKYIFSSPEEHKQIKYLCKKNIICSIDNFVIDIDGNLILDNNNYIPIKSYFWLFKSIKNNYLDLNIITNLKKNLNKIDINTECIKLDDKKLLKKIIITNIKININTYFNKLSKYKINELCFIKFKNMYIFELNERILFELKSLIISSDDYNYIIELLFKNKYVFNNDKIIMGIIFLKKSKPFITINNKHKSINQIINKYKNNKEINNFIKSFFN